MCLTLILFTNFKQFMIKEFTKNISYINNITLKSRVKYACLKQKIALKENIILKTMNEYMNRATTNFLNFYIILFIKRFYTEIFNTGILFKKKRNTALPSYGV